MLKVVLIDDERPALDELQYFMEQYQIDVIGTFQNTVGVIDFVTAQRPDLVFLDIELRNADGIALAEELQNLVHAPAIIFVTAHPQYALQAFQAHPMDYLVKPIDSVSIQRALQHAQKTLRPKRAELHTPFSITCFGRFEISYLNTLVKLPTKKTEELLAYLLCREGEVIIREDLLQLLFDHEDMEKSVNHLRVALSRIRNSFAKANIGKELFVLRKDLSVVIADGICDMVDFQRFIRTNTAIHANNIHAAEKAVSKVNGQLLSNMDARWITEQREWLLLQTEKILFRMVLFYLKDRKYDSAERLLLQLLDINQVSEPCYHRLLELYMQTGDILKYRHYYERYRSMMAEEFKEPPVAEYTRFYKSTLRF